jgi:hypothetical protein
MHAQDEYYCAFSNLKFAAPITRDFSASYELPYNITDISLLRCADAMRQEIAEAHTCRHKIILGAHKSI